MNRSAAAVMVSRRCNMTCAHCSVESNPHVKSQPDADELRKLVTELVAAKVPFLQFTGGEPMLREELLLELIEIAGRAGIPCNLVSNGYWGKKPEKAHDTLERLLKAGLVRLSISYDRFHAKFQGPQPALNIIEAARRLDTEVHIHITRAKDDHDLDEIVEPFRNLSNAHLRFYDLQAVGYARNLKETLRGQLEGFCSSCEQATFTDDGRVTACNGPAYFQNPESALIVGDLKTGEATVSSLLARHQSDPILQTIRVGGPSELRSLLKTLPGFEDFPFRDSYSGMCELCLQITSSTQAVSALRKALSEPEATAERLARQLVLGASRRRSYNRFQINRHLAPVLSLKLILGEEDSRLDKVFGRADLDWEELARNLQSRDLLSSMGQDKVRVQLRDWAPVFFWQRGSDEPRRRALLQLREVTALAKEHGLALSPRGSTKLLAEGSPRAPILLHFTVPNAQLEETRALLKRRLDYPVALHLALESPLEGDSLTAWEILQDWRGLRFKGGLEVAFDLHRLKISNWDEVLAEAAKFGMARSLSAGLSVLEAEVKPLEGVRSCIQNVDFASRVARYQFARQRSERDNAFLEVALSLACLDRPGLIFRALQGGIQALVRESSLKSLKEDVFQAWEIARGRETKAHPSSESPPLEG